MANASREGNTMTMRARPGAEHLGDGLHPSGHIGLDAREFTLSSND
jgi:hypothetical protein